MIAFIPLLKTSMNKTLNYKQSKYYTCFSFQDMLQYFRDGMHVSCCCTENNWICEFSHFSLRFWYLILNYENGREFRGDTLVNLATILSLNSFWATPKSYLTKVPAQTYLIKAAQSVSALGVCRASDYSRGCLLGERQC